MEEIKSEGNGKLTDEQMLKLSEIEINDIDKYTGDDRRRWTALKYAERLERYQKNPDSFFELSEIVCMAIRNDKSQLGISIFFGNAKRSEMNNAIEEINHVHRKMKIQMDVEAEMKHTAITNMGAKPHNMIDGARKMFRR
jgi:hypothetical protein